MSEFGGDSGNFLLDEVECTGLESSIEDCSHSPWRIHDCHSYEAAGAVCIVGKGEHFTAERNLTIAQQKSLTKVLASHDNPTPAFP